MKRLLTLWPALFLLGLVACAVNGPVASPLAPSPHQVILGSNSFGFPQNKTHCAGLNARPNL
jgi:hypothetical protein